MALDALFATTRDLREPVFNHDDRRAAIAAVSDFITSSILKLIAFRWLQLVDKLLASVAH